MAGSSERVPKLSIPDIDAAIAELRVIVADELMRELLSGTTMPDGTVERVCEAFARRAKRPVDNLVLKALQQGHIDSTPPETHERPTAPPPKKTP